MVQGRRFTTKPRRARRKAKEKRENRAASRGRRLGLVAGLVLLVGMVGSSGGIKVATNDTNGTKKGKGEEGE
jgi:hypothetical protein